MKDSISSRSTSVGRSSLRFATLYFRFAYLWGVTRIPTFWPRRTIACRSGIASPEDCSLVSGRAALWIDGVESAPKRFQRALGGAEHRARVGVLLSCEPFAPRGAMPHIGFLVHGKIRERARLTNVVEAAKP